MLDRFACSSGGPRPAGGSYYLSTASAKATSQPGLTSWRGCAHQLGCLTLMAPMQQGWRDRFVGFLVLRQRFAAGAYPRAASPQLSQARRVRHQRASLLSYYRSCCLYPVLSSALPSILSIFASIGVLMTGTFVWLDLQVTLVLHHVLGTQFQAVAAGSQSMPLREQF